LVEQVARDKGRRPLEEIARKFHNTICRMVVEIAGSLRTETGLNTVALSGGVFQNRILTESVSESLRKRGFRVLLHQIVPPNDGGISLGQAVYGGLI
jgi:hydrogenase maturation protein HypF